MIPLVHDLSGATVLVVGGGRVGARKARHFSGEAARVVALSPAFADEPFGDAERVRAAPGPDDAAEWVARVDPALVVAATDDPDANAAFAAAGREAGALVNRADESGARDPGSVVVPATVEDPPVTVAVTTGGTSPALSRYLRERVEADLDGAGAMADLTADLRADLEARGVPASDRHEALRAVVRSERVWKGLRTGAPNPRDEAAAVVAATLDGGWDADETPSGRTQDQ